uniref:HMG box domain-containing protein n=1 Tax=Clastoptera arizonana TaxID=38151 RepID=A0A1B6DBC7_9HEMI
MALTFFQMKILRLNPINNLYRNVIFTNFPSVLCHPSCGIKHSIIDKLGLPPKPKKPPTAFLKFLKQIRPSIVQENPKLKAADVAKIGSKKWETIDPKLKTELEAEFKQQMKEFFSAMQKYETQLSPKQLNDIKEAKLHEAELKQRKLHKQKIKTLNRPKRPAPTFLKYMQERQSERGDIPVLEWQKKLGRDWENLSPEKKQKYEEQAKKESEQYFKDLKVWEQKMIDLGHLDMVRTESLLSKPPSKK